MVSIGQDGTVRSQGIEHLGTALTNDPSPSHEAENFLPAVGEDVKGSNKQDSSPDGKLIIAEEIAEGHVTWKSVKLYLSGLGGDYPFMFFSVWIFAMLLTDWANAFQVWFLGYWGSQYETHPSSEINPFT